MNPFSPPSRILVCPRPQDMRAGIERLAGMVTVEFGEDPTDESLYVFVSRKADRAKMLRYDTNGWCLYYVRLSRGTFRWRFLDGASPMLSIERKQLLWLLEGLEINQPKAHKPVAGHILL